MRRGSGTTWLLGYGAKAEAGEALIRVSGFRGMATGTQSIQDDARFLLALALEELQATCSTKEVVIGNYTTRVCSRDSSEEAV